VAATAAAAACAAPTGAGAAVVVESGEGAEATRPFRRPYAPTRSRQTWQ